jgi:hypothetical protein
MSILDSVGGFVRDAGGAIADTAKSGAKAAGDAFDTAVETAKAGANAVVTTVREVDEAKEKVGSWIDSKAQQLEHKVDEGRAWLRENGGVAGKVASAQIGLVEGVATSVYGAGKGLVQLADGVSSVASPLEWAANPDKNIARLKSGVETAATIGKIANMTQPSSWIADPKGNAKMAGALWDSAATSFNKDPSKFVGNAVGTVGMFFIPGGQGAAAGNAGKAANVASNVGKIAEVGKLAEVGKVAEVAKVAEVGKVAEAAKVAEVANTANGARRLGGLAEDVGAAGRVAARAGDDVAASGIARGHPHAFGIGERSARAEAIIDRSAQALGRNPASLVDNVIYNPNASSPFFWVDDVTGARSITIDAATFGKTEAGQMITGTHELVHAEQWEAVLASHGGNLATAHPAMFSISKLDYAIREVVTERRALQVVDSAMGGLTPQQIGHSSKYIEMWQQAVVARGGTRVP